MSLNNDIELANTQRKLERLEALFEEVCRGEAEDSHSRDVTLRSLKGTINQFKEEIVRYRSRKCLEKPSDGLMNDATPCGKS